MKNNKKNTKRHEKIKVIITDLDGDTLGREELDFNTIEDAKSKIILHKISTEKDIKIKIYDNMKLVHTEHYQKPKKEKKEKKEKKDKDDDDTYA